MSEESEDFKRVVTTMLAPAAPHLRPSRVLPLAAIAAVVTVTILVAVQGPAILSPRLAAPEEAAPAAAPLRSASPTAPAIDVTVRSPQPGVVSVLLTSDADHDRVDVQVGGQVTPVAVVAGTGTVVRFTVKPGRHRWSVAVEEQVVARGSVTVVAEQEPVTPEPVSPVQPAKPTPTKKKTPKPKDTPIGDPTPVDPED